LPIFVLLGSRQRRFMPSGRAHSPCRLCYVWREPMRLWRASAPPVASSAGVKKAHRRARYVCAVLKKLMAASSERDVAQHPFRRHGAPGLLVRFKRQQQVAARASHPRARFCTTAVRCREGNNVQRARPKEQICAGNACACAWNPEERATTSDTFRATV